MKRKLLAATALFSLFLVAQAEATTKKKHVASHKGEAGAAVVKGPAVLAGPDRVGLFYEGFATSNSDALVAALVDPRPLTWHGITLFGNVDVDGIYQRHGNSLDKTYPYGVPYGITRSSNKAGFNFAPGGLGYNTVGGKGAFDVVNGVQVIFEASTNFDPVTGYLLNGPDSLVRNNGKTTVPGLLNATPSGDSSRGSQPFNNVLFGGVKTDQFGSLTFGRHANFIADQFTNYDPMGPASAFSLMAFTGTLSGGGTSEVARIDDSLKYKIVTGPIHAGALFQVGDSQGDANNWGTFGLNLGMDAGPFSIDTAYQHTKDAITLSSLSSAQVLTLPNNTLAGSLSNNDAVSIGAKYSWDRFKFFAGYEYMNVGAPSDRYTASAKSQFRDANGYNISALTVNSFDYHDRIWNLYWAGAKYAYDDHWEGTVAYYHWTQNAYGQYDCKSSLATVTIRKGVTQSGSTCSGAEDAVSGMIDYHVNKRFEVYGGLMYTVATNGLAAGYLYHNNINPTIGARFNF
jgi:predicted porin